MKIHTVAPLIMDPLNKGHNRNNLSIKGASKGIKCSLSHSTNTFLTSEGIDNLLTKEWLVSMCQSSTVIVNQFSMLPS